MTPFPKALQVMPQMYIKNAGIKPTPRLVKQDFITPVPITKQDIKNGISQAYNLDEVTIGPKPKNPFAVKLKESDGFIAVNAPITKSLTPVNSVNMVTQPKKSFMDKVKEFYQKYKKAILIGGGVLIAGVVAFVFLKKNKKAKR